MMILIRHIFFILFLFAWGAFFSVQAIIEPDDFMKELQKNVESPRPPILSKEKITQFRYVFIAGFLNEGIPSYFKDNQAALKEVGVPESQIHVIYPLSTHSIEQNIEPLYSELQNLSQWGPELLVVFAHSKGGAEVLAVAIAHPEFILEKVKYIFLIQAALHGSAIADYLHGEGHAIDEQLPFWQRLIFKGIDRIHKLLDKKINKGLGNLTHKSTKKFWSELIQDHEPLSLELNTKIYYLRASKPPEEMAKIIKHLGHYLSTYYGENDGLLELKDQKLGIIGTPLGILKADHTDLTTSHLLSKAPPQLRRALMRTFLQFL